jgi:hypothetical protein
MYDDTTQTCAAMKLHRTDMHNSMMIAPHTRQDLRQAAKGAAHVRRWASPRWILKAVLLFVTFVTQATALSDSLNFAAAFTWHGYMDTDLNLSEFFHQDHTVMARFMLKHPKAYEGPILTVNGSGVYFIGQGDYRDGVDGAKMVVKIGNAKATYTLPNHLVAGKWLHVALVRVAGTWIAPDAPLYFAYRYWFYLNGVYRAKDGGGDLQAIPNPLMPNGTLRLGATNPVATASKTQFYGFVDDVAIFNKALTASQVQSIYNSSLKRLTGNEPDLIAGYTFDSATPSGQPLSPKLSRTVTIVTPAYKSLVTQARQDSIDAALLPLPVHQISLRLPFDPGQVWKVTQGYEGTLSHNGYAAFALDLVLAGVDASGRPKDVPLEYGKNKNVNAAAAGHVLSWTDNGDTNLSDGDDKDYENKIHIEHAPGELTGYLHILTGSSTQAFPNLTPPFFVLRGTRIAGVGYGNGYHLHFGAASGSGVNRPVAFSNYEYYHPGNDRWYFVEKGTPQQNQYIRRREPWVPLQF